MNSKYKTKIILERHGQSEGNAKQLFLGHTDLDLSEEGYRQAEVAAAALASEKIDVIYSSDLIRAHNTAAPHARIRGLDVIDDKNLRELYLGEWEGQAISYLLEKWNDDFILGWRQSFGTYCPPGGEAIQDLATRIYNEVMKLARENEGKTILIASHAAAIRSFWCRISEIPPEQVAERVQFPTNASFTTVYFDGEHLIPHEYSNDKHFSSDNS